MAIGYDVIVDLSENKGVSIIVERKVVVHHLCLQQNFKVGKKLVLVQQKMTKVGLVNV